VGGGAGIVGADEKSLVLSRSLFSTSPVAITNRNGFIVKALKVNNDATITDAAIMDGTVFLLLLALFLLILGFILKQKLLVAILYMWTRPLF
jgi:hypothetical protein